MLRWIGLGASSTGLALTVLPALGQGAPVDGPRVKALLQAAQERDRAIVALREVETRVQVGHSDAIAQVRSLTEPVLEDARSLDMRLETLRQELAQLELALEAHLAGSSGASAASGVALPVRAQLTIGLDADELSLLAPSSGSNGDGRRAVATAPVQTRTGAPSSSEPPTATPTGTFSHLSNPERLRQARTAFLAKQYERSLSLLDGLPADLEVLSWRGRALERLGRLDESLGALRLAIESPSFAEPQHATLAARVQADFDYVHWMQRFQGARGTAAPARSTP